MSIINALNSLAVELYFSTLKPADKKMTIRIQEEQFEILSKELVEMPFYSKSKQNLPWKQITLTAVNGCEILIQKL